MTTEEFAARMQQLILDNPGYEEVNHILMDDLLCEALADLGYQKGVDLYHSTNKWYE